METAKNGPPEREPQEVQKDAPATPPSSVGEPEPVTEETSWLSSAGKVAGVTAAVILGGAVVLMVAASMTTTRGATRSARLEWERRQQEIGAVAAQTAPADAADSQEMPEPSEPAER